MANGQAWFAALSDPTRRQIFERLVAGGRSVGELAKGLPVSRPAVSQHLKVLKEAGLGYGNVVKTTIYMTDLAEFTKVNEIYGTYFPAGGVPPARSTVQVAALPRGARIEIDVVAVR